MEGFVIGPILIVIDVPAAISAIPPDEGDNSLISLVPILT